MTIWFNSPTLDEVRKLKQGTMLEHLGIELTELGPNFLVGTMPVDHRTKQPAGLLHGGASVVLAETLASIAGNLVLDSSQEFGVGLEINANHLSSVTQGFVSGHATPIHLGKTTQVWETRIHQEISMKLVCISRMTLAVLRRK